MAKAEKSRSFADDQPVTVVEGFFAKAPLKLTAGAAGARPLLQT